MQPADVELIDLQLPAVGDRATIWKAVALAERLVAGILLAVSLPLLLVASCIVMTLSRNSPLVGHRRIAQGGRLIWLLKLRTMWDGKSRSPYALFERLLAPEPPSIVPKIAKDPRVRSRFAVFCRRYSIDELPQLWHVVRGDLALVGPRPLTLVELDAHYGMDAAEVLARRPGITGLWQVRGRSRLTYKQRRELDLFMVRNWSASLYLEILIATLPKALSGKDAW